MKRIFYIQKNIHLQYMLFYSPFLSVYFRQFPSHTSSRCAEESKRKTRIAYEEIPDEKICKCTTLAFYTLRESLQEGNIAFSPTYKNILKSN